MVVNPGWLQVADTMLVLISTLGVTFAMFGRYHTEVATDIGAGLARDLMHQMDETIVIPQSAQVESLNAGVAASIVLYEAARRRK